MRRGAADARSWESRHRPAVQYSHTAVAEPGTQRAPLLSGDDNNQCGLRGSRCKFCRSTDCIRSKRTKKMKRCSEMVTQRGIKTVGQILENPPRGGWRRLVIETGRCWLRLRWIGWKGGPHVFVIELAQNESNLGIRISCCPSIEPIAERVFNFNKIEWR